MGVKHRTGIIGVIPNPEALLRLAGSQLSEAHDHLEDLVGVAQFPHLGPQLPHLRGCLAGHVRTGPHVDLGLGGTTCAGSPSARSPSRLATLAGQSDGHSGQASATIRTAGSRRSGG